MAKIGPRKLSGEDVAKVGVKQAFLVKSLAQRFQDEAQDVAKIGSRSFLGEISGLEISR